VRDWTVKFLPGTGRWRAEGVTEGSEPLRNRSTWLDRPDPSTILRMVPLPVPGRIVP
jgi:hypothetical protein